MSQVFSEQIYIKTFMKIKQEASGWSAECDTEEKKRNYLQQYEEHEGIRLDYDKVEKNPGLRSLAKLMLNSFWGKFGQRPNQTQVTTCTKPSEFFQIIKDDQQVIHRIKIVNHHMIEIFHSFQDDCDPVQTNVNIFVACFTTSYAQLKLYNALDILQQRVLYFDTDSIIYTQKPAESLIPTLNERGQKILHFSNMKDLVLNEILLPKDEPRTLTLKNPHKIARCPATKTIKTLSQDKKYKLIFDKRVMEMDSLQSFPYGYKCSSNRGI